LGEILLKNEGIFEFASQMRDWFILQNYKGIDPYQMDEKAFAVLKSLPFFPMIRKGLKPFHSKIPSSSFSKFPPIYHPKSIGLIISGNSYLYQMTQDKSLLSENNNLINILESLKNPNYLNACWGHPFEWGHNPRFPFNIPLVCVQTPVIQSILDYYAISKNKDAFKLAQSAIQWLVDDIEIDYFDDTMSLHNSPLTSDHVHNSNIMTAALFYRFYKICNDTLFKEYADKLIQFTIQNQNKDGSWDYSDTSPIIDNRHTGFVLSALSKIYHYNQSDEIKKSLERGEKYYYSNLFDKVIPKWSSEQTYPVDIHDVAQAIITAIDLKKFDLANEIIHFAINDMSNGKDTFYYKLFASGKTNKTIFIRWGQAWMYMALIKYLSNVGQNNKSINTFNG